MGEAISQGGLSEPIWAPSHHLAAGEPERTAAAAAPAAAPPRSITGNVVSAPSGLSAVMRLGLLLH